MDYLLIVLLAFMATTKVTVQSFASKRFLKSHTDMIFYNTGVFLVASLLFLYNAIGCSYQVWLFAMAIAVVTVSFQLFYTEALSIGNVSLSVMMANFSMVMPLAVSFIFYNEPLSIWRIIGVALTIVAIVLVANVKGGNAGGKKWFVFSVLAALSSGAITIVQKIFNMSAFAAERGALVSAGYAGAFLISAIIYLCSVRSNKKKGLIIKEKRPIKLYVCICMVGIVLSVFQWLYNYSLTVIDGTFFFPTYSGVSIILSTVSGVLLFKDKLNKKQVIGIIIGIVAIVLMSF